MADNVAITAGTGTTVATDDVGGAHYQEIKLVDGTKESNTPVAVNVGVKANALRVAPANDITDATYIGDIKFGEAEPNSAAILADTTSIDGKITACNTGAVVLAAGTAEIGKLAAGTAAIGKLAANSGVDIGDVDVTSVPAPLSVVGTGTEAAAMRVTIATDSTGVLSVDDNGSSLTVDGTVAVTNAGITSIDGKITACNTGAVVVASGTVTAELSATDNAVLDTIDAVLDTINAKLVTGTVIGDVNLGATDNAVLDTIDAALDAINAKLVTGTVIGDVNLGATDNAVLDAIAASDASIDGKITACNTGAVVVSSGTVTAELSATDNAVLDTIDAVLDTINAKLVTGTVIGDVNLGATDNAVLDTIDAALDAINAKLVTGTVIGDVNLGATDNAVLDAIAASDASIDGKITACNTGAVVVSSGTVTAELSATDNAVLDSIVTNTNRAAITGYGQAKLDHADVTTAQVLVAAVTDKKFYLTSITLSVAAAGSYWIEDDDAAQITCKFTLAANGGLVWSAPIDTPWKSTTVNKGLKVKGSAAGVVGCMITYYTLA
jgi:hypothetical protein